MYLPICSVSADCLEVAGIVRGDGSPQRCVSVEVEILSHILWSDVVLAVDPDELGDPAQHGKISVDPPVGLLSVVR